MKCEIRFFKKKRKRKIKKMGVSCFFCKEIKETIGYIFEASGEKLCYFFCKICLIEILENKIIEVKKLRV